MENNKTLDKLTNTVAGSELDRLITIVTDQSQLLSRLEDRLAPVSQTVPSDETQAEGPFHLTTSINAIQSNNKYLERLISQLVI